MMALIGSLVIVLGTSGHLKHALGSSGIYQSGVDQLLDNTKKDAQANGQESLDLSQPGLQAAAKTAVTPAFLQNTAEQVIDGMYNWLGGKTKQPEFSIDIAATKQKLISALGDYAVNRAKQLPPCTVQQARELAASGVDPLNLPCVPAGFDVNGLREQVANQVNDALAGNKDNNILQQPVLTPDNLPKDEQGKTPVQNLTEKASKLPKAFHWFKLAPWIFGVLAVLSAAAVYLLDENKRKAIRSLAIGAVIVGVVVLLGVLLTNVVFNKLNGPTGPLAKQINNRLELPAVVAANAISNDINHSLVIYALVYVIAGTAALFALHFTKPKLSESVSKPTDETSADSPLEEKK